MISEIIYIDVEGRYCNIITEKGKFVILISLTKIMQLLNPNLFGKASRNAIVNLQKIEEIFLSDNLILLSGDYNITFSDKYKDVITKNSILK